MRAIVGQGLIVQLLLTSLDSAKVLLVPHSLALSHVLRHSTVASLLESSGVQTTLLIWNQVLDKFGANVLQNRSVLWYEVDDGRRNKKNVLMPVVSSSRTQRASRVLEEMRQSYLHANYKQVQIGIHVIANSSQNSALAAVNYSYALLDPEGNFWGRVLLSRLNIPYSLLVNAPILSYLSSLEVGNLWPLGYLSSPSLDIGIQSLSFLQRAINVGFHIQQHIIAGKGGINFFASLHKSWTDYLRSVRYILTEDTNPRATFSFLNAHPALLPASPVLHTVITYKHIDQPDPESELDKEILSFALSDEQKNLVVVSQTTTADDDFFHQLFFKVAESMPDYRFVFVSKTVRKRTSNSQTVQWVNMNALLSLDTTCLFVHNGGLNTVMEAAHYGVPSLCFPQGFDQQYNCRLLYDLKLGGAVPRVNSADPETVKGYIINIASSRTVRKNLKKFKRMIHDTAPSTQDPISFWTAYVHRQKDVTFLTPKGRGMSYAVYFSVDVVAVFTAGIAAVVCTVAAVLNTVYRWWYRSSWELLICPVVYTGF